MQQNRDSFGSGVGDQLKMPSLSLDFDFKRINQHRKSEYIQNR